ncbi:hypothetical protein ACSBR2_012863 [Camellia fascicularis]
MSGISVEVIGFLSVYVWDIIFFVDFLSVNVIFIFSCSTRGCVVIEGIEEILAEQEPKKFSFETLYSATEGFHAKNKLGKGSFAVVYKGKLNDGREIAVKRPLLISDKGKELVLNEMELLLGSAHHRNIVKFLGYCSHDEKTLLVFEFASNGSLDNLVFKTGRAGVLDWKRTYDIFLGVARGLLYLHEQAHSVIIHCDIKPANILIDGNWVPKIADFGTARVFPQDQTHVDISKVTGTPGYIASEYGNNGHVSPKADTYNFGVVVLELISSQKNLGSPALFSNAQSLLDRAKELYKEGKIGVMCTKCNPKLRPTMAHVYSMLLENHNSSTTLVEEPIRDGSSSSSSSTARKSRESNSNIHSV